MGYIVSLGYLCNLVFFYIEAPMNVGVKPSDDYVLTSLMSTDVFFQNKSSITQSIALISVGCMRKMKDHQTCLSLLH